MSHFQSDQYCQASYSSFTTWKVYDNSTGTIILKASLHRGDDPRIVSGQTMLDEALRGRDSNSATEENSALQRAAMRHGLPTVPAH